MCGIQGYNKEEHEKFIQDMVREDKESLENFKRTPFAEKKRFFKIFTQIIKDRLGRTGYPFGDRMKAKFDICCILRYMLGLTRNTAEEMAHRFVEKNYRRIEYQQQMMRSRELKAKCDAWLAENGKKIDSPPESV